MKQEELKSIISQLKKVQRSIIRKARLEGIDYWNSGAPYINNAIETIEDIISSNQSYCKLNKKIL